jgi:hypothetical protein
LLQPVALWIVFHDWSAVIMLAIPALRSTSYLPTERRPRAQKVPILQGLKRALRATDPPKRKPRLWGKGGAECQAKTREEVGPDPRIGRRAGRQCGGTAADRRPIVEITAEGEPETKGAGAHHGSY